MGIFRQAMATAAVLSLLAGGVVSAAAADLIGIAMPTKSSQRWITDGESL